MDEQNKNYPEFDFIKKLEQNSGASFIFPNIGISFLRVDDKLKNTLLDEALRMRQERTQSSVEVKDGYNFNEYNFFHMKDHVLPALSKLVAIYENQFNYTKEISVTDDPTRLVLSEMWVNFMQSGNYNSMHTHGGIFSFVIWLKIPYDLQKELKNFGRANDQTATINTAASCFSFIFSDIIGRQKKIVIPVDEFYEGVICLFPSTMMHSVHPFYTSNEERISVAGNLYFKTIEENKS